jgi:hypothetical protein
MSEKTMLEHENTEMLKDVVLKVFTRDNAACCVKGGG